MAILPPPPAGAAKLWEGASRFWERGWMLSPSTPLPLQPSQGSCFYYLFFGLRERNNMYLQKCPLIKSGVLRNIKTYEV